MSSETSKNVNIGIEKGDSSVVAAFFGVVKKVRSIGSFYNVVK